MRISDWSAYVCSSDLRFDVAHALGQLGDDVMIQRIDGRADFGHRLASFGGRQQVAHRGVFHFPVSIQSKNGFKIGSSSCRETVCLSVYISGVAASYIQYYITMPVIICLFIPTD